MAWNEPGGNRNDNDPWGGTGGGRRGNDQGGRQTSTKR